MKNKKNKNYFFLSLKEITIIGMMVSLITVGRFLDNFMPQISGYTFINLWCLFSILAAILLKWNLSIFTFISSFLLWIIIGKAGLEYGIFSILFDYLFPLLVFTFISFHKNLLTFIFLLLIATLFRHLSYTVSGYFVWNYTIQSSFIFNFIFAWGSTFIFMPFFIAVYKQLLKLKYIYIDKKHSW